MAGVYSSAHIIKVDGVKNSTTGYVEIGPNGQITAYEQDGEGFSSVGSGCYRLAAGTATNAGLQGRILKRGVSPQGDAVYQTLTDSGDTFGILVKASAEGNLQWFFHWGNANSTVRINGSRNVVNTPKHASYSISGPALTSPTPEQLHAMVCGAEAANQPDAKQHFDFRVSPPSLTGTPAGQASVQAKPVASGTADQASLSASGAGSPAPSPLSGALPFDLGSTPNPAAFASFGIAPDSPKAHIAQEWAQKIASDPDIKKSFSTPNPDPAHPGPAAMLRALSMLDGMQRISPDDRAQLLHLSQRALANAPPDCGGVKNLQVVTRRYLSLNAESDEEFRAQLRAMFNLLKQSTETAPPPQITAAQRLQAQLALSASISKALKQDPAETDDLGLMMSGRQAELSPTAWCKATRFYQNALNKTPQPERDWMILAGIQDQKRIASALSTMLKNLASLSQASVHPAADPPVFDYADAVRKKVRQNIVWSGKTVHGETVVEVNCSPTGSLESVKVVSSSGDPDWDNAALKAVRLSDPMPLDANGKATPVFRITLRP